MLRFFNAGVASASVAAALKCAAMKKSDNVPVPPPAPQPTTVVADNEKQHILPATVLKQLLTVLGEAQKAFLLGRDASVKGSKTVDSLFVLINACYESRMKEERTKAVAKFTSEREAYYMKRVAEETEEFRRERREVHDALFRAERTKYMNAFQSDIQQFTVARQAECETNLKKDIEQYHSSLRTYRARANSKKGSVKAYDGLEKDLAAQVLSITSSLEEEDDLFDFGSVPEGKGSDITDEEIRRYVEGRVIFYEQCLQEEIDLYTVKRRQFYEDLIKARKVRHAAKIRVDTAKFKENREKDFEVRLKDDASWMSSGIMIHYNRCFLQCYARQAWLTLRTEQKIGHLPLLEDLSGVTLPELQKKLPIMSIVERYEREALLEPTRDVFLQIAKTLAKEGLAEKFDSSKAPAPSTIDPEDMDEVLEEDDDLMETEEYEEYEEVEEE